MYDDEMMNKENKNTSGSGNSYQGYSSGQYGYSNSYSGNSYTGNAYTGSYSGQNSSFRQDIPNDPPHPEVPPKKKKKGGFGKTVAKCVALALIFGLVSGSVMVGVNAAGSKLLKLNAVTDTHEISVVKTSSTYVSAPEAMDVSHIVEEVMPCIVAVNTTVQSTMRDWFGRTFTQEGQGAGSGIIISKEGGTLYVMTNYHVIEDATQVSVQFSDNSSASASIKGYNEDRDIAVLTIDLSEMDKETQNNIRIATLGDSDTLKTGETAIAIGNALGYGQSVTTGVVSATSRDVSLTDKTMTLIQTSAAINPGNSGGALLNGKGEVIGVNTVKFSDTDVEGMGFAIPINQALEIAKSIIEGTVMNQTADNTPFLGITGGTLSEEVAEQYGAPAGVYISNVSYNSAAQRAGLIAGCIITGFNGEDVATMEELQEKIAACLPGDSVTIVAQFPDRDGKYTEQTLTTIMGARADVEE